MVFLWAAIAEVCLVGVGVVWLMTSAGAHAGYGRFGSIAVLVLSVLLTAIAMVAAVRSPGIHAATRITLAGILALAAAGVVPLVITDLVAGPGVGLPLALAVAGMEILVVHLIRAGRTI